MTWPCGRRRDDSNMLARASSRRAIRGCPASRVTLARLGATGWGSRDIVVVLGFAESSTLEGVLVSGCVACDVRLDGLRVDCDHAVETTVRLLGFFWPRTPR